jgi:hypothetical protein
MVRSRDPRPTTTAPRRPPRTEMATLPMANKCRPSVAQECSRPKWVDNKYASAGCHQTTTKVRTWAIAVRDQTTHTLAGPQCPTSMAMALEPQTEARNSLIMPKALWWAANTEAEWTQTVAFRLISCRKSGWLPQYCSEVHRHDAPRLDYLQKPSSRSIFVGLSYIFLYRQRAF